MALEGLEANLPGSGTGQEADDNQYAVGTTSSSMGKVGRTWPL